MANAKKANSTNNSKKGFGAYYERKTTQIRYRPADNTNGTKPIPPTGGTSVQNAKEKN